MQSCMIFVPFIGWLVAVIIKFITNYIYYSTLDLKLSFSNGGFPSVHTATIITTTTYIGFYDNFNSPLFILAVTIAFIIMIDATHLRRSIGKHASILNHLTGKADLHEKKVILISKSSVALLLVSLQDTFSIIFSEVVILT